MRAPNGGHQRLSGHLGDPVHIDGTGRILLQVWPASGCVGTEDVICGEEAGPDAPPRRLSGHVKGAQCVHGEGALRIDLTRVCLVERREVHDDVGLDSLEQRSDALPVCDIDVAMAEEL